MMVKMGWQQGKTLGTNEQNPTGLLNPLVNRREGIIEDEPIRSEDKVTKWLVLFKYTLNFKPKSSFDLEYCWRWSNDSEL